MRILLGCPYDLTYLGGVTNHVFDVAQQFVDFGHEVIVAGPCGAGDIERVGVHRLGGSIRFRMPGDAARVNLNPWIHRDVSRLLAHREFDVLHLHEPFLGYIGASFLRYADGLKVGTFHTWRKGVHWPYRVFNPIVRNWDRMLHGRIAVSDSAAETANRYVPGDYRVIPNGIYYDDFAQPMTPPEHLRDNRPTLLFVGRLEPRKGVPVLLEAFRNLKQEVRDARLIIAGEGRMKQEWMALADAMGLTDVLFEGYVPREELPAYYHRADVFCSPSIENESFGITLLEAMAAGCPVIATRDNGSSTLGEHGGAGLIVEPGDAAGLSDAIEMLLSDRNLRGRMSDAARERARQFEWSVVAASILEYYAELSPAIETSRVPARAVT